MYHCPITIINIVRTKGKAGYRVLKLAGGQGDQDINLPWGSFEITFFFDFLDIKLSVANPLLITQIKLTLTKTFQKGVYIIRFSLFERRGWPYSPYRMNRPELIWISDSAENSSYPKHIPNTFLKKINFQK